jgi:hypothetical protein
MNKIIDYAGKKFNKLTAIIEVESKFAANGNRRRMFLFQCDCGVKKEIRLNSVTRGETTSCGCNMKEKGKQICIERNTTHGMSGSDLHKRWLKIKGRCFNPNDKRYKDYGGRGIGMSIEWRYSFSSFHDWAINNGYEPHFEIDRKNNDEGYTPENCRFVTTKTNCNNKRTNIIVDFKGQKKTLTEACEELNMLPHYRKVYQQFVINNKTFKESILIVCLKLGLSVEPF